MSTLGTCVYVSNLHPRIREYDMEVEFSKVGTIVKLEIIRDPFSKMSRGYGFVTFERSSDAVECVKKLNNTTIEGKMIRVEHSRMVRGYESTPGTYLGNNRGPRFDRRYRRSPNRYRSPRRYSRSPRRSRSKSPRRYYRSPRRSSPRRYSRSPRRQYSRSPRRYSRSPRRYSSRSPPHRYSRSPKRQYSRSPRRY
mmetsp:Transcript_17354/g.19574  ORF Transcript_17354/g.19574 Transcript_17354/m.19574 type:complete len:195 (-) Transcript_17354:152-736(-)